MRRDVTRAAAVPGTSFKGGWKMNLNLLDITIIVILAFYLISGMYRGFITSLLGTVGFVGAWFGAQPRKLPSKEDEQ